MRLEALCGDAQGLPPPGRAVFLLLQQVAGIDAFFGRGDR
jgi:hypothetical protein